MTVQQIIAIAYLGVINLLAFMLYGFDKRRAVRKEYRISERSLLWMATLGGGIGSWLGMRLFRHKTKHLKFRILVPLWVVIWACIIYVVTFGWPQVGL